jgi:hypothetical protein
VRLYFDTAYIAKCYLNEPEGRRAPIHRCRQVREGRLSEDQAAVERFGLRLGF